MAVELGVQDVPVPGDPYLVAGRAGLTRLLDGQVEHRPPGVTQVVPVLREVAGEVPQGAVHSDGPVALPFGEVVPVGVSEVVPAGVSEVPAGSATCFANLPPLRLPRPFQ